MTDRVLRWLTVVSLVLLAIGTLLSLPTVLVWAFRTLPELLDRILFSPVLPRTAFALGEVTGVATLVISLQRRQWGWFGGVLLCLVIYSYASLALQFTSISAYLIKISGGSASIFQLYVTLYEVVPLVPLLVVAAVYAWTRRQPVTASTAI